MADTSRGRPGGPSPTSIPHWLGGADLYWPTFAVGLTTAGAALLAYFQCRALLHDGNGNLLPSLVLLTGFLVSGVVTGLVWLVTRRQLAAMRLERERRGSEARLAGLISIAADAIITIDDRQRITLFNEGAEAIFRYARGEVMGKPLEILLPERFRAQHARHIERFGKGPTPSRRMGERQEIFGRRRDGEEFPAEASIARLEIDGIASYTVVLRDISARRSAERELVSSKETLELAIAAGRIGIFEIDHRKASTFWSETLSGILGDPPVDPSGPDAILASVADDDRDRVARALSAARECAGDGTVDSEHRVVKPGGEVRWVRMRARTMFEAGVPVRTVGAVIDVTDRRASQDELERRIAERTRELEREIVRREETQSQLVRAQRLEAVGQLTGGIAHDFNNLLTVVTGNLELLEMRLTDARDLTLLRRASEAAGMGARLTERLLTFARRRRLDPVTLDLNEHVITTAELLRRTLGETITLTTVLEAELWKVRADPSEVENAILNLAINARDAMPGGGRLIIETANVAVDDGDPIGERRLAPGRYVRLAVTDTGHGMSPEVKAKAFEPFFTTKQAGKGTGLGLSTVYGFAQQSGGTVTIYSEPGHGTTVNIYLPRAEPCEQGQERAVEQPAQRLAERDRPQLATGETILLIEDNAEVREVTARRLRELGFRVLEVASGEAAIEELAASRNDVRLVLSDVVLGSGRSGFDVARWVRENRPALKVLLTSGYPDAALATADGGSRRLPILRKPYSGQQLARAIEDALHARAE